MGLVALVPVSFAMALPVARFAVIAATALFVAVPVLAVAVSFGTAAILLGIVFGTLAYLCWEGELEYFATDELLDGGKARLIIDCHKGDGTAIGSSAGSTADTMHIVFAIVWCIVIDDEAYVIDVDATRHDIGGYEDVYAPAFELAHHHIALRLVEVAVHLAYIELHALEGCGYLLDLELG